MHANDQTLIFDASEPIPALRRILAIRLDNIGDVVMTGPALRALRQAYPQAQITLMASPAGSQVAPLLPWVDDVITWRAVWQDIAKNVAVEPEKEYALVELIAQRQFDAAFIFTSFSQSPYPPAYACYLAKIPIRAGQSKEFGGGLLSHWVSPLAESTYQVDRNLHLLRSMRIPTIADHLELQVKTSDQQNADAILSGLGIGEGQPYLVLAPGASAEARRYSESRFAEAAQQLTEETGLPVVLVGSQREVGKFPVLEALAARQPRIHSLIGQTSVPEMAALIGGCALLLANNSGSMHIGAALNRPMLILFSGTELLDQWAPHAENVSFLNRTTECTPCHGFQCRYQMECLDIPVEEVVASALSLLKTTPPSTPNLTHSLADTIQR
jgi:lipopolysaccharide heptosyltransferase II